MRGYSIPDEDNATLLVHQHFFGIGNASLNKEVTDSTASNDKQQATGLQMAYPRSLSSQPTYYDRYTFRMKDGNPEPATSSLLRTSMRQKDLH